MDFQSSLVSLLNYGKRQSFSGIISDTTTTTHTSDNRVYCVRPSVCDRIFDGASVGGERVSVQDRILGMTQQVKGPL